MKYLILFILLIPLVTSQATLSEVMYNPNQEGEWIEIYTNQEINLSGFLIQDNYYIDEIVCCRPGCSFIVPEKTFIIVGEIDEQEYFFDFCVDDKSIGNGLGNNGDTILIYSYNYTLINFSYNDSVSKGYSLSLINGSYLENLPTPGSENIFHPPKPNPVPYQNIERGITNQEYYLFKLENDYGQVEDLFYYNVSAITNYSVYETHHFYENVSFKNTKSVAKFRFSNPGDYILCGEIFTNKLCYILNISDSNKIPCNISLSIEIEKNIYEKDEKIEYYIKLSNDSFSYDIEYWIEDIFGNKIKSEHITHNTNKRRYTPKINQKEKPMLLCANLNYISCNNTAEKTSDSFLLAVKGDEEKTTQEDFENKIEIEIDNSPNYFGEIVFPKLKITKGDTSKYSVKLYVEKNNIKSDPISLYVYGKNKDYEIKLPILLNHPLEETGTYYLVADGLGLTEKVPIKITKKEIYKAEPELNLIYYSQNITNKSISILQIKNKNNLPAKFEVWSYVYSGSKTYSGNRTLNKKEIRVDPLSSSVIVLENYLQHPPDNNLKLKIKILENDKKTPKEITKNITILKKQANQTTLIQKQNNKRVDLSSITGKIIYKSSSSKIKDYITYFFVAIILLSVYGLTKIKRI